MCCPAAVAEIKQTIRQGDLGFPRSAEPRKAESPAALSPCIVQLQVWVHPVDGHAYSIARNSLFTLQNIEK